MRGADGSYAFVYFPSGKTNVTVNTGKLSGERLVAWWFDRVPAGDAIRQFHQDCHA